MSTGRNKVVGVRFTSTDYAALQREAKAARISVSTLVRLRALQIPIHAPIAVAVAERKTRKAV